MGLLRSHSVWSVLKLGHLESSYLSLLRYKKNLKALYVVHPTNLIKALWNIFKPLIR